MIEVKKYSHGGSIRLADLGKPAHVKRNLNEECLP